MLKASLLLVMRLALLGSVTAQNLVPNPSFEEYRHCPNRLGQIDSVAAWWNIGISPDYFNTCADDTMSVPQSALGYQWPADGEGYAGLGTGPDVTTKEYMQAELDFPLVPGAVTFLSMRVSPGGFGMPNWASPICAASHVGLRLSTQPLPSIAFYGQFHFNTATLFLPTILSDTTNWTVLSGSFVADSAYRYVQIGCFFADSLIASTVLDPSGGTFAAYAFVDMVCVAQVPGFCDDVLGTGELERAELPDVITFGTSLLLPLDSWAARGALEGARLFDGAGRLIADHSLLNMSGTVVWELPNVAPGGYYLLLKLANGSTYCIRSWKMDW